MEPQLDRFDSAEMFTAAAADGVTVDTASVQLKKFHVVEVHVEGLDQRFLDEIAAEGYNSPRAFLLKSFAKLSPTLGVVYTSALVASDEYLIPAEKQSRKGVTTSTRVFRFRTLSFFAARQVAAILARRFESRLPAERLEVRYVQLPHKQVAAAPAPYDSFAPPPGTAANAPVVSTQLDLSSASRTHSRSHSSTPLARPVFGAPVFGSLLAGRTQLSFATAASALSPDHSTVPKTSQPALFKQSASTVQVTPYVQPGRSSYSSALAVLPSAPMPRYIAAGPSTSLLRLPTATKVTGSSTASRSSFTPLPVAASAANSRESSPTAPIASTFATQTSSVALSAIAQPLAPVELLATSPSSRLLLPSRVLLVFRRSRLSNH